MSEEESAATRFYCETVPDQFNATLSARALAGQNDPAVKHVHDAMRAVNTSIDVIVLGEREERFSLNIDEGMMTVSSVAAHSPLLTLIHDKSSLKAFSLASGNSILGFLAGLTGRRDEMMLTSQRIENLRLLAGCLYFELRGTNGFSLTFLFGERGDPNVPDCSLFMDDQTYRRLRSGELAAQDAFMNEEVRIEGDMEVAVQLAFAALAPDDL